MMIIKIWIKKKMAFIYELKNGDCLEYDAVSAMQDVFLQTFPYIARHLTEKEKEEVSMLLEIESYGLR